VEDFLKNNNSRYFAVKVHKMSFLRKDNSFDPVKKHWSLPEAKVKIAAFCAYQERCQKEVRDKLLEKGIGEDEAEDLIVFLITEGYLNEERFAKSFVRGKFRIKKWGKRKILYELRHKELSEYVVKKGLAEIEDDAYWEVLLELAQRKHQELSMKDPYQKRDKIFKYLYSKGYETHLIEEVLKEI
jgi:regulatory protein